MATAKLAPSFLPATAVLEMTYKCNHACQFCSCPWYAPDSKFDRRPELSVADWKAVITRLSEMGCCDFAFTGGEPLLKDGIEEIIEHAARCRAKRIETEDGELVSRDGPPGLYLLSNGKIMSDQVVDMCKCLGIHLSMSLPGLTTFPELTHCGMDANHVLNWFRKCKEAGISTTVGITVTSKNINELYENISEALIAGADTLLMNRFLPGGRGLEYADELRLSQEQIIQMLDTAEEVLRLANRDGSVGTELPKCLVDEDKYNRLKVGTRCSAALDFFVIDPSGFTRVCNHSETRLEHINQLEQLKENPYWRRFTQKDYLPDACLSCSVMGHCDGGCREAAHIVGGCIDALDPDFPGCPK